MKRVWTMMLAAAAIVAVCSATTMPAVASAAPSTAKVTIVIATGLSWADITPTSTPTLWQLAQTGGVGDVNARMRNRENNTEPSTSLEGALDLSAGNWAMPSFAAAPAYDSTESADGISAAETFRRITGRSVSGSAICFPGMPMTIAANSDPEAAVVVGTLGQAVHDAGGITGAIGNSDAGQQPGGPRLQRPAAVAAVDSRGLVDAGDVSADLLRPSADAPYGLETDLFAFGAAMAAFDASATAHGGPSLLVLDPGDAYRARRNSVQASPEVAAAQQVKANIELDQVVGVARSHSTAADTLIVVSESPTTEPVGGVQGFGPLLVSGPGMHGYLNSASTHRPGILTNLDVTAAALEAIGVARPVQIVGNPFTTAPAPASAAQRIAHLSALDATAVSVDSPRSGLADVYIRFFVGMLAIGGLFVAFRDRFEPRARRVIAVALAVASLLTLAVVPAGWVMFILSSNVSTPTVALVLLGVASLLVLAAGCVVWRVAGVRASVASLSLFAVVLLVADQFFGAPLSFVNFMGYSPLQSARYYGIGNQPSAYLVGAAIVGVALVLDRWDGAPWAGVVRRVGLAVLGAIVVFSAAAPFLGANVGVAIWGSAGFVVAWALMNGRRISWKLVLVAAIVIVLLIAGFAAVDVLGHGAKTHLARSLTSAQEGGIGQLWLIVARKAQTNARVLGETQWAWALYATIAFVAAMLLRRGSELAEALAENPALRASIYACAVACVFAFLTEDSGIIVPAFLVLPLGAALLSVMLGRILAEKPAP